MHQNFYVLSNKASLCAWVVHFVLATWVAPRSMACKSAYLLQPAPISVLSGKHNSFPLTLPTILQPFHHNTRNMLINSAVRL
jgi:hypothetical protein